MVALLFALCVVGAAAGPTVTHKVRPRLLLQAPATPHTLTAIRAFLARAVQVFFSLTRLRNRNAPPLLAFVPLTVRGGKALKHEPLATLWLTVDDENDNE